MIKERHLKLKESYHSNKQRGNVLLTSDCAAHKTAELSLHWQFKAGIQQLEYLLVFRVNITEDELRLHKKTPKT